MKEEFNPWCPKCCREQHIYLEKPLGENVIVCEFENRSIRIRDSLECVDPNCVFCKCAESVH